MGARSFGFQNSGLSNGAIHDLSTTQVNPLLPLTAVSYPCGLRTRTVALSEMATGAALRASAISAPGFIRYSSRLAIRSYGIAPLTAAPGAGRPAGQHPPPPGG